ncbi:hypothetical protein MHM84_14410 [Halomonas sp. McH1-25]|uniref:hypothetical protein n=1 Tax=unclassified Halomonas TaxID=2609666 RepID=UPI001EF3E7B8|nr:MULTISPECIES: hypothetical protein [unclassified Halomonas]MCG7600974.1 hypothetical protein [Halomonas sp. McH1-25]MCP1342066.1 hypothetical protein [Halomonas sp. FL8]MCP1359752.1 hypothetical protein [Halomonas sp. BBD45]MCP1365038.1 hypothetical protein [Halomonas sp. BBD48]
MDVYLVKPAPRNEHTTDQSPEWWVVDTRDPGEDVAIARFDSSDDAANEAARLNSVGV